MLTPERPLRADAQRTREALLDVARTAFAAGDVDIRIDEIARRAHVGVGTFYRHFDTRNAILEAVYRLQLRQLCEVAPKLVSAGSGAESLRSFLEEMMRYAERNRGMAAALGALARSGSPVFEVGRRDLLTSLDLILEAGRAGIECVDETVVMRRQPRMGRAHRVVPRLRPVDERQRHRTSASSS